MKEGAITLDRLTISDAQNLANMANNKNVWDNLRDIMPYPYAIQDAKDFISLTLKEKNPLTFSIRMNKQLCGVCGLTLLSDVYQNSAELGYWIGEEYWGKGVASEAVRLISAYGFDHLNLERIQAGVFEFNIASMKVLIKNGYKKEGEFIKAVYKNDRYIDEHRFAKLRSLEGYP